MVRFAAGARNKLHTHSTEQILVVTEGKGIIATKDQEHIVKPGMIAFILLARSTGTVPLRTHLLPTYQ